MTPVWHDGAAILVNGSEPYPSRSLYAESRGEQIWSIAHNGFVVAALVWSQYARQDGSGFASKAEALAYLQGEHSKNPTFSIANVTGLQAALDGRALLVHTHAIADVTGLQAALDGKQPAGSYAPLVHTHAIVDVTGLQTALDGKAAVSHTHTIAQVTGLQAALDGKQVAGCYAAASHTHVIADVTGLQSALDGKQAAGSYAPLAHTHAIADVTGLTAALAGKAAVSHTHVIADVTGLQTALDGKAALAHTHTIAQVTGLQTALDAATAQRAILTYAAADLTWTYPTAFAAGVVPVIEALAVGPAASTALFNVQLVGDPTNTSCKFRVNTIPAASVSLLGLTTLTLFQQAPSGVKIHATARNP